MENRLCIMRGSISDSPMPWESPWWLTPSPPCWASHREGEPHDGPHTAMLGLHVRVHSVIPLPFVNGLIFLIFWGYLGLFMHYKSSHPHLIHFFLRTFIVNWKGYPPLQNLSWEFQGQGSILVAKESQEYYLLEWMTWQEVSTLLYSLLGRI